MIHANGTVDEVPLAKRPLLSFRYEERLAVENEEILLVSLPVVHRHRVARIEDEQVDPVLLELGLAVEAHHAPARPAVVPHGVARVDDEPALAAGGEAVLGLFEPGFGNHRDP